MTTDPPIGSPTPGDPCSPCSTPPADCGGAIERMQRQLCDLQTNYLDVLTKYKNLLSQVQAGTLSVKDFASQLDQIQNEINDLSGGNCANLGQTQKADALIVCSQGQQKVIAAPSALCQTVGSFQDTDGNPRFQLQNLGADYSQVVVTVLSGSTTAAGPTDFPVTLPGFPAFKKYCLAMLNVNLVNQNSGASSSEIDLLGVMELAHCGPQSQDVINYVLSPVTNANITFRVTATGTSRTTTFLVNLMGYLFR